MSDGPILYDVAGGVATITLDRPEARNSLSPDLIEGLYDRLVDAAADPGVRVVVVTNTGNTFCAGADLKSATPGVAAPTATRTFPEVFQQIFEHPKPVIGRVAGHCVAGGMGLAASLDISVATTDATFAFTEVRIGVAPALISVVVLPKLRYADAMELFLTGERISAERAAEIGLINHAVAPDDLDAAVEEVVAKLRRGAPNTLAMSKQLLSKVPPMTRADAFAWTGELSQRLFQSEEGTAGIAAFREKRDPPWVTD